METLTDLDKIRLAEAEKEVLENIDYYVSKARSIEQIVSDNAYFRAQHQARKELSKIQTGGLKYA